MKIVVIGSGNMGSALIAHLAKKHSVVICDRNPKKGEYLAREVGASYIKQPSQAVIGADFVLVAVKPKDVEALAQEISSSLTKEQHIISILAGTKTSVLRKFFPNNLVIRLMPNLAIKVNQGIIGLFAQDLSEEKKKEVEALFASLGLVLWIAESKMEAFASLAASSPAFIIVLIEAMIEAGVHSGLSSSESKQIVLQVLEGTAGLLTKTDKAPEELKWQICSPGGTTIDGIKALEENSFRMAIWKAIEASHQKGEKMGG